MNCLSSLIVVPEDFLRMVIETYEYQDQPIFSPGVPGHPPSDKILHTVYSQDTLTLEGTPKVDFVLETNQTTVLKLKRDIEERRVQWERRAPDWTADEDGKCNSSERYEEIVKVVARAIRMGARDLLLGNTEAVARQIVSQLAHVHHLAPTRERE